MQPKPAMKSAPSTQMSSTVVGGPGPSQYGTSVPSSPGEIDYHEAINDSPRFRNQLQLHNLYFQRLEARLNEILRYITAMVDFGKNYASTFYKLSVSVNQLCEESFSGNALAQSTFHSLSEAYARTVHLTRTYHEESNAVVYNKLQTYIKNELTKVTEARALFESMAQNADDALSRNAGCSRQKHHEAIETRNNLMSVGACFAHTTLDYVERIHMAHAHKDHDILDALWSFVKESGAFFSRGHAFFDEWTAMDNGGIADTVKALEHKVNYTSRQMQDIHSLVPVEMYQHPTGISPDPDVVMEGYLYKRSSNAFKTWNRRWFQIKDNKFLYLHRSGDDALPTVMEENLMLCLVRPAPASVDRVGCFELVTPSRTHLLQADSESLCNIWMRALQRTILHLHESDEKSSPPRPSQSNNTSQSIVDSCTPSTSTPREQEGDSSQEDVSSMYSRIRSVGGNTKCADCGHSDPKWASINLGVTLCIECCGIHRSLGVQVSKVRSLTMDSLDEDVVGVFTQLGNDRVNGIYLAYLPEEDPVPPPANEKSTRAVREAWIKAKYVEKRFAVAAQERAHHQLLRKQSTGVGRSASSANVQELDRQSAKMTESTEETHSDEGCSEAPDPSSLPSSPSASLPPPSTSSSLLSAATQGDLCTLLKAIAKGTDINQIIGGTTLLHTAVEHGQTVTVEFLLLNGAKINLLDDKLNTALHIAAKHGHTLQVCQLLKRGGDKTLCNGEGHTPLEIAVEGKDADIVTLFRVHTMRDEFNEEFDNPMNQTYDDVILDITRRAAAGGKGTNGAAGSGNR